MHPVRSVENKLGQERTGVILAACSAIVAWGFEWTAGGTGWLASAGLGFVLGVGVFYYWTSGDERKRRGELGRSIMTAALVGLALALAQASANRHSHDQELERQAFTERGSLAVSLGLQADLRSINLDGRDLAAFYLPDKDLSGAQLSGADLCIAYLARSKLRGANLVAAALRKATMQEADLSRALLVKADLSGAFLEGADLRGALLTEAILTHAGLAHADLRNADLTGAVVTGANFDGALYDSSTRWPQGFDPSEAKATLTRPTHVSRSPIVVRDTGGQVHCFSPLWRHASPTP